MTDEKQQDASRTVGLKCAARFELMYMLGPAAVAIGFALWFGAYPVDDAYITYRYAENLACGKGFVFNEGEAVLGTTTPLYTLILAAAKTCGLDVPGTSRVIGTASFGACVFLVQLLAARGLGLATALGIGLCSACYPGLWFSANSGMETCLSLSAVLGGLALIQRGQYGWAGLVGGAAFLLRPDGALIAVLAFGAALLKRPRRAYWPAFGAGVVAGPWLAFAYATYGRLAPYSIKAKQLIHPDTPVHILSTNIGHLTDGIGMQTLLVAAGVGLVYAAWRKREFLPVGIWILLYLAGMSCSRIAANFPWYITPTGPIVALLAGCGAVGALRGFRAVMDERRAWGWRSTCAGAFVLGAGVMYDGGMLEMRKPAAPYGPRVADYLHIGEWIAERSEAGDAVLVGEVGAMAYVMPEQYVLDSAGINSPRVYEARRKDWERSVELGIAKPPAAGTLAWVVELIEECEPRYVATCIQFVHGRELIRDPRIMSKYRRVTTGLDEEGRYLVLERH